LHTYEGVKEERDKGMRGEKKRKRGSGRRGKEIFW
jgi:hypothetical protein